MRTLFLSVVLVLFQVSQKKEIYVYSSKKNGEEESIAYKSLLSIQGETYIYSNNGMDGREVNVNDVFEFLENEKAVFNLDTLELSGIINSSEGDEYKYSFYENGYILFKKGFGITKLNHGNENLEYRLSPN